MKTKTFEEKYAEELSKGISIDILKIVMMVALILVLGWLLIRMQARARKFCESMPKRCDCIVIKNAKHPQVIYKDSITGELKTKRFTLLK